METKNSAQVQANIPNASLSSYEPVKISLADAPSAEAEQLEGYKRAMAAMELAMRVCGDIDPADLRASRTEYPHPGSSAGRGAGDDSFCNARRSEDSLEQYERMTALQASDMVNQGLALDAWARHYGIEPSEEDVMEMIESMAPGHEKELLEELSQDPAQLEALSIAVMRFAANKHLAATAIVE